MPFGSHLFTTSTRLRGHAVKTGKTSAAPLKLQHNLAQNTCLHSLKKLSQQVDSASRFCFRILIGTNFGNNYIFTPPHCWIRHNDGSTIDYAGQICDALYNFESLQGFKLKAHCKVAARSKWKTESEQAKNITKWLQVAVLCWPTSHSYVNTATWAWMLSSLELPLQVHTRWLLLRSILLIKVAAAQNFPTDFLTGHQSRVEYLVECSACGSDSASQNFAV